MISSRALLGKIFCLWSILIYVLDIMYKYFRLRRGKMEKFFFLSTMLHIWQLDNTFHSCYSVWKRLEIIFERGQRKEIVVVNTDISLNCIKYFFIGRHMCLSIIELVVTNNFSIIQVWLSDLKIISLIFFFRRSHCVCWDF